MQITRLQELMDRLNVSENSREFLIDFFVSEFSRLNGNTIRALGADLNKINMTRNKERKSRGLLLSKLKVLENLLMDGNDLEIMETQSRLRGEREERSKLRTETIRFLKVIKG